MRVGVGYKLKYLLALSVVCIFFANCFICPPLPRQIAGHICCKMTSTGAGYWLDIAGVVLPGVVCVGAWQLLSAGHKGEHQLGGAGHHRQPAN